MTRRGIDRLLTPSDSCAMSTTAEKLITDALELPAFMRAFVAEKLLESLDTNETEELSKQWKKTIKRRCQEIDESRAKLIDAEEAFEKAYAALS